MARINQRLWKIPGQRTKRKAWGFTTRINGTQVRRYKAEWTQDNAEAGLAKALLQIEPQKPKRPGMTLAQATDRYLASKARKRTIEEDRRQLGLLKTEFGAARVFKTRYIKTAYKNAVAAAQLDDVTFHTLRHTFASWAIMRGGYAEGVAGATWPFLPGHDDAIRPPCSGTPPHGG